MTLSPLEAGSAVGTGRGRRVLIVSGSVGAGHDGAARELAERLRAAGVARRRARLPGRRPRWAVAALLRDGYTEQRRARAGARSSCSSSALERRGPAWRISSGPRVARATGRCTAGWRERDYDLVVVHLPAGQPVPRRAARARPLPRPGAHLPHRPGRAPQLGAPRGRPPPHRHRRRRPRRALRRLRRADGRRRPAGAGALQPPGRRRRAGRAARASSACRRAARSPCWWPARSASATCCPPSRTSSPAGWCRWCCAAATSACAPASPRSRARWRWAGAPTCTCSCRWPTCWCTTPAACPSPRRWSRGCPAVTYRPIPGHGRANAAVLDDAGLAPWARTREELCGGAARSRLRSAAVAARWATRPTTIARAAAPAAGSRREPGGSARRARGRPLAGRARRGRTPRPRSPRAGRCAGCRRGWPARGARRGRAHLRRRARPAGHAGGAGRAGRARLDGDVLPARLAGAPVSRTWPGGGRRRARGRGARRRAPQPPRPRPRAGRAAT